MGSNDEWDAHRSAVKTACELLEPVRNQFYADGADTFLAESHATFPGFYSKEPIGIFTPEGDVRRIRECDFQLSNLIEQVVPGFFATTGVQEPAKVSDSDNQRYYLHKVLCHVAARWLELEGKEPLPDPLKQYVVALLRGEIPLAKRQGGNVSYLGRDLTITRIVEQIALRYGLAHYDRKSRSMTACDAVADAIRELGFPKLSAKRVEEIFRRNRPFYS